MRAGKRRPIHLQRMEADDLLAAVWPGLAACQENAPPGPLSVPDHVLARQTVDDCLHEGLSVEGLVDLWSQVESGQVELHLVESSEPSVFAHGILTGRPFTFLDGAPLEERRTRALSLQRGLGALGPNGLPVPTDQLDALDPDAVAMVLDQVRPELRNADELHDLLLSLVMARPVAEWSRWFAALEADGRAALVEGCWVATERHAGATSLSTDDEAAAACVGGHLQLAGPVTVAELTADAPLPSGAPRGAPVTPARARTALARLEAQGSAIELPDGRWCARHLLVRLHGASRQRRRGLVAPVPIADYVRFLTRWQHAVPSARLEGRAGLLAVLEQLQGIEAPAVEWEAQILPARVAGYDARWLDELCLSGEVVWGRLTPRAERAGRPGTPSPATPLAFVVREDLPWMLRAVRAGATAADPEVGAAADVLAALRQRGACFRPELAPLTGRLPAEVDEGLWDLVARGIVTADAFSAVRSLLSARDRWRTRTYRRPTGGSGGGRPGLARRRAPVGTGIGEGRWSLLPVDPARARRGDRRPGVHGPAQRGAGRGRGVATPGPLGGGGLGGVEPGVLPRALARGGVGAPPPRGSRGRPGRPLRGRALGRAVRPARRGRGAGQGAPPRRQWRRGGGGRGRSAQRHRCDHGRHARPDPPVPERDLPRRRGGGHPAGRVGPWDRRRLTSMPTSVRPTTPSAARWSSTCSASSPRCTWPAAATPGTTSPCG